jgi:ubiquinone/menaquinone biosynthesis C-methylase UbiE
MKVPWRVLDFVDRRWPRLAHMLRFNTTNVNTPSHWDSAWTRHGRDGFRATDELLQVRRRVLDEIAPNSAVLDVGCGVGELLAILQSERGCHCAGLDISAVAVAKVRERGIEAVASSLPVMPYAAGRFDAVVCTETMEHVSDAPATLREIARVLKDRGRLILSVPDGSLDRESVHVHRFTREKLRSLLTRDFRVESMEVLSDSGNQTLFALASKRSGPADA